jgi:hypothetical protein
MENEQSYIDGNYTLAANWMRYAYSRGYKARFVDDAAIDLDVPWFNEDHWCAECQHRNGYYTERVTSWAQLKDLMGE